MGELTIDSLLLSAAMEDMLVDALVFGGDAMLRGVTYKALKRRGLAESAGGRRLTREGERFAKELASERATDQTVTPEILRDLASVTGLTITADGLALIEAIDDMAVSAAERAAERGAGCDPTCGCGVGR